jgi:TIR domain
VCTRLSKSSAPHPKAMPPTIFISYSQSDTRWKERLSSFFNVFQHEGLLNVWHDGLIQAGGDWLPQIESAMAQARVAILLVSVRFLNSEFVRRKEVPTLMERRQREGLRVIPVIVSPCPWQKVPWLSGIQARPLRGKTLEGLRKVQQDELLTSLAEEVVELLAPELIVARPAVADPARQPETISPSRIEDPTSVLAADVTTAKGTASAGEPREAALRRAAASARAVSGASGLVATPKPSVRGHWQNTEALSSSTALFVAGRAVLRVQPLFRLIANGRTREEVVKVVSVLELSALRALLAAFKYVDPDESRVFNLIANTLRSRDPVINAGFDLGQAVEAMGTASHSPFELLASAKKATEHARDAAARNNLAGDLDAANFGDLDDDLPISPLDSRYLVEGALARPLWPGGTLPAAFVKTATDWESRLASLNLQAITDRYHRLIAGNRITTSDVNTWVRKLTKRWS